jgi:hypothetical protein
VGSGISGVEPSGSATREAMRNLLALISEEPFCFILSTGIPTCKRNTFVANLTERQKKTISQCAVKVTGVWNEPGSCTEPQ